MSTDDKKDSSGRVNAIAEYVFDYSVKWYKNRIVLGNDKYGALVCIRVIDCFEYYDTALLDMYKNPPVVPIPYKISKKLRCSQCNFVNKIEFARARRNTLGEDELVDVCPTRRNCCVVVLNSCVIDTYTIAYWRPLKVDEIAISTLRDFRRIFVGDAAFRHISSREATNERNSLRRQ